MSETSTKLTFNIRHPAHRRAVRTAIAILLATALVYLFNPSHGEWIILSAFLVSQDTVGSSLWKAKGRLWGAVAGAIASLMIYALLRQHPVLIFIAAFLTIFPYVYLVTALNNYRYAFFFLQVAYVCFLASIGKHPSAELIEWRAMSIAIGISLGILVALFVLPTSARPQLQRGQVKAWTALHHWFEAIISAYSSAKVNHPHLEKLGYTAQQRVFSLDEHLASRKHELIGKAKVGYNWSVLQQKDTEFIQSYRPIYRSLLYLNATIQSLDSYPETLLVPIQLRIQHLEATFEQLNQAIRTHAQVQLPPIHHLNDPFKPPENSEVSLTLDEENVLQQMDQLYGAIAAFNATRNGFLSLLRDTPPPEFSPMEPEGDRF
jgi:uncharacterized membrane protein YccC